MSAKLKKGLGRGFDSLVPTEVLNEAFDPTASQDEKVSELRYIKLDEIFADPDQPRRHFDETALQELSQSIAEHGVVQPIVVVHSKKGFQIVAGERRYRAAKLAKLTEVPALIRTLSNQHKLELSLIENLQRRDLNPLETATAYLKLRDQFNLKLEEIGKRIGGKSASLVSNSLRLLRLPDNAKQALVTGKISEGHARQILALDDKKAQNDLLKRTISGHWSVRRAEQYVIGYKKGTVSYQEKRQQATKHTQTQNAVTRSLSKKLQTGVRLKTTAKGGQLIIEYKDGDELSRIAKLF